MAINPMDYSGKDTVLDALRSERANFYTIVDDPNNWYVQTRCSEWEVRDVVGHLIDVTEGYLARWEMADDLTGVQATFHFKNPSDFVLTCYQRFPGGETSGDPRVIEQIRHLFFRI